MSIAIDSPGLLTYEPMPSKRAPMKQSGSVFKERILGLFKSHPDAAFQRQEIYKRLPGVKPSLISYWLEKFVKDESLIQPKYGYYGWNKSPVRKIDEIRAQVLELGKARVVSTDRPFVPTEAPIQAMTNPTLVHRQRHFRSIIDRMKANPAFSEFDIELLTAEAKHLVEEQKMVLPS